MAVEFGRLETCEFIGFLALDISKLAQENDLPSLRYIADMLYLEAKSERLAGVKAETRESRERRVAAREAESAAISPP